MSLVGVSCFTTSTQMEMRETTYIPRKISVEKVDPTLQWMRVGMREHLSGNWESSNEALTMAYQFLSQDKKGILGEKDQGWNTREKDRNYHVDPYELAFIHTLGMINFSMLGEIDSALVEARRADLLMNMLAEKNERAHDDPLARYFSAKLYQTQGAWSDAYIDLVKAYEAYISPNSPMDTRPPSFMGDDLFTLAEKTGRLDDIKKYKKRFPKASVYKDTRAELWVMVWSGRIINDGGYMLKNYRTQLSDGRVVVSGSGGQYPLEEIYDFLPFVKIASGDRSTRKFTVSKAGAISTVLAYGAAAAFGGFGPSGNMPSNSFPGVGKTVRDYHWDNLPATVWAAKLKLPPGKHLLKVVGTIDQATVVVEQEVNAREGTIAMVRVSLDNFYNKSAVSPSAAP